MHSINDSTRVKVPIRLLAAFAIALVAVASFFASTTNAYAQENDIRFQTNETLRGNDSGEQRTQNIERINNALRDVNNNGYAGASHESQEVIWGMSFAGSNTDATQRLINDGLDVNAARGLINNEEVMNELGGVGDGGARRFLENNLAQSISQSQDTNAESVGDNAAESGGGGSTGGGSSGELSLESPHTYSDILASVIMSRSSNGANMDSTSLPMSTLNKYPSKENNGGAYGRLNSPKGDDAPAEAGSAAASYIEALFKFQWIIGGDYNDINGHGQLDGIESKFVGVSNISASIYDTISSAIEWLSDATSNLNIANLLGLTSSSRDGDNWLSGWVRSILQSAGLSSSFAAIQYVAIAIVGGLFLFFLMRAVNSDKNRVRNDGSVKSTGARIAVMILAIPFATVVTATLDGLTHDLSSEQFSGATSVNSQYVVDTLHWAAAANLSTGLQPTPGAAAEDYDALVQPERIGNINSQVHNKLASSGLVDKEDKASASSMLEALRKGKVANVNDYFGMIQNVDARSAALDGSLAASRTPMASLSAGIKSDSADQQLSMIQPYFLSTRKNLDGADSSDSSSSDSSDKATSGDGSGGGVGSDDGENGSVRIGNGATTGIASFKCGDAGQMTCDSVAWNKPATYIFGASSGSNNSEEQSDLSNFIAGAGSHQNYDPETREKAEGEVDGTDKARVMESNNHSIAIMNRYAGADSPGALSTQSTAFILQSEMNDGTLNYHGYNTTQSPEGSTKNTGVNGKVFQRYVIPNSGEGDLASKVASISVMWMCAGIISVVAFFALFRAPILGAVFNMFKGFFQALIAGNVAGLLRYALYYLALRLSFVFASTAITAALLITDMLNGMLGGKAALGSATEVGQNISDKGGPSEIDIPGPVNIPNPLSGFMETVGTAVVVIAAAVIALILTFIVCWPFLSVGAASKSGRPQKFSVVSLLISLPYIMAENACDAVDRMAQKLGHSPNQFGLGGKPLDIKGRGKSSEVVGKAASTAKDAVAPKASDLVDAAKGAVKGGATGGLTGAAMGAVSSRLAGLVGNRPGTNNDLDEETSADARSRVPGDVDGQGVGPDGQPLDETRELPTTQPALGHADEEARVDADVDGGESKTEASSTEHAETGESETERLDSKSTTSDEIQGDSIKIDKADIGEANTGTAAAAGLGAGAGALLSSGEGLPNKNEAGNVDLHADNVNMVGDVDGGDAQVDTDSATTRSEGAVTMPDAQVEVPGTIDAQGPVNTGGTADTRIDDAERKTIEHRSTTHAAEGDSMRAPGGADGAFDAKGLVAGAIASATAANVASNDRIVDALEKNRSETRNLGSSVERGTQATNDVRSSIRGDVSNQLGQVNSSIDEQTSRLSEESSAERTRDMRQDALSREFMRNSRNESENIAKEVRDSKRN